MKSYIKYLLPILSVCATNTFAVNPVSGWYGGLLLGGSYTPNVTRSFTYPTTIDGTSLVLSGTGKLEYSILGGVGVSVGHRWDKYRAEAQLLYNSAPYHSITFTGDDRQLALTMGSNTISTKKGDTVNWNLKGNSNTIAGMINAFYDFLPNNPRSSFAPYVGAGIGMAYVTNSLSFSCVNNTTSENCAIASGSRFYTPKNNLTSIAGQGILGISYFMDDFAWFSLDGRYFLTASKTPVTETRVQFASVNVMFSGVFDGG